MISRLSKSIRQYWKPTILTPIFMTFEVVMEVIIPRLMTLLIDNGLVNESMPYIVRIGTVLIIAALVCMVLGSSSGVFAAKASAGFAKNLRQDMYYNLQNFSFRNIDKFSASSLVTRLTTDVTNVQNSFQLIIRMSVRCIAMLILSFAMVLSINTQIAIVFLCVVPILGGGLYFIMSSVHPTFVRVFKTYDNLNRVVQENVRGIRVVKSFVREEFEKEKFSVISKRIYDDFNKAEKRLVINSPLMQFCLFGCMLITAWLGAKFIVSDVMTTGQLMSIITYALQILMSLMFMSMVLIMAIISRASAERIVEILKEPSDLTNCASPVTNVEDGSVIFKQVNFSYTNDKNKFSLSGVNLEIKSGETVGILGGTGSSKTSLVQLIPRLYDTTEGKVCVGGVDVKDYDMQTLRNEVAFVLQKNVLFSGTIKENLRWGNENASDEELIRVCKLAQADEFIRTLPDGYNTHIEQGGSNVSGGQKQRICIARALLKNPKILILDDSTSAVDTKTDALIRHAFKEEIPNTTKIIIAQRLASVQDADKIVIMDGGRIMAVGKHDELLQTSEIYKEVFHSQTKGGDFDETA